MASQTTFSCNSSYDGGGLGRHLSELVEAARARGESIEYFCRSIKPGDEAIASRIEDRMLPLLLRTIYRFSPQRKGFADCDRFDRMVSRAMTNRPGAFVSFGAQSLHSFARARALGAKRCILMAGSCHVDSVHRRHVAAGEKYPIEKPWLGKDYLRKAKQEYASADLIYVSSEFSRQTFLAENVPETKLQRVYFEPSPRFKPPAERNGDDAFRIVYTGALSVAKGIPVLIDAFRRFKRKNAELVLVGSSSTRSMRQYLEKQVAADRRIRIAPGDPLPYLHRARVYVHPSFDDAYGYAPMEAMRCGLPVIVTEDTGMKEYVRLGENGYIVPSGQFEPILALLEKMA